MAKSSGSMFRGEFPDEMVATDWALHRDLEAVVAQAFYDRCDRTVQAMLQDCDWLISITAQQGLLLIYCPDLPVYGRVLRYSHRLIDALEHVMSQGLIQVCSGGETSAFCEFSIGESCRPPREGGEA
jgi:hypothetical protein